MRSAASWLFFLGISAVVSGCSPVVEKRAANAVQRLAVSFFAESRVGDIRAMVRLFHIPSENADVETAWLNVVCRLRTITLAH